MTLKMQLIKSSILCEKMHMGSVMLSFVLIAERVAVTFKDDGLEYSAKLSDVIVATNSEGRWSALFILPDCQFDVT